MEFEEALTLAEKVLKEFESKTKFIEARVEDKNFTSISTTNSKVESVFQGSSCGIGFRFVSKNGCLGFFSLNENDFNKAKSLIESSITLASSSQFFYNVNFSEEKTFVDSYEVKQKKNLLDHGLEERLEELKLLKSSGTLYVQYVDDFTHKVYLNSQGSRIESKIPVVSLYYFLTLANETNSTQRYFPIGASSGLEVLKEWNLGEKLVQEEKELLDNLNHGVKLEDAVTDYVITPEVSGIACHESVGHPYEADRILGREAAQAGESFIKKDSMGIRIGSDEVTVIESPLLEHSFGYYLYDDEGVKARERKLIENGIVKEFLQDRSTAHEFGIQSNASSRAADYDKEPLIRMSNTYLKPGNWDVDELIKDTKKGVLMKSFGEWNIDDRRFNMKFVANNAFLIENGEITKPVKNVKLEISTPELWSKVNACCKDFELHAGNCGKGEPMQGMNVTMGGCTARLDKIKTGI